MAVHTEKKPGHLVLGEGGALYIVASDGTHQRHEQPRRRKQREIAEAFRARMAAEFRR